jgi:hypothetical protein
LGKQQSPPDSRHQQQRRPSNGNVNIDFNPKEKKGETFKGGDYIKYEELD